jgi:mannitol/fructose-specific phosphotransferase system IIA component (Ntr-type)
MNIVLDQRHVRVCQKWASMRRTIEEAARLLAVRCPNETDEEIEYCLWELSEIVPTIEAMQMAVREAANREGLS